MTFSPASAFVMQKHGLFKELSLYIFNFIVHFLKTIAFGLI